MSFWKLVGAILVAALILVVVINVIATVAVCSNGGC